MKNNFELSNWLNNFSKSKDKNLNNSDIEMLKQCCNSLEKNAETNDVNIQLMRCFANLERHNDLLRLELNSLKKIVNKTEREEMPWYDKFDGLLPGDYGTDQP
jgi:hypothetical protein